MIWTLRARLVVSAALVSAVALVGLLARCSSDGIVVDAGEDVLPQKDVRFDVVLPADGGDASADAADVCALYGDWPGFRRLKEFDPCMPVDVLVDPDAGYNLAWTDCGDAGIDGCAELVHTFETGIYAYATHDDSGSGQALFVDTTDRISPIEQFDVFDLPTRTRVGEWRVDDNLSNGSMVVLANGPASTTAFLGWKLNGFVADVAPASVLAASNPMILIPYAAPNQDINWALSEAVMAFQPLSAPYAICQVDAGTCVSISNVPAPLYLTFAWHDVAFAIAEHGTAGWAQEYVIHTDGSVSLLRSNVNAHIWGMTTDGISLVWEETYGSTNFLDPQTTTEIWKAPFTTDKATLDSTATKVTTLPQAGIGGGSLAELCFFNGLYATYLRSNVNAFYVVDVATGQTQNVPAGPGGIMLNLPYVDRNELWEVTSTVAYQDYLVRIPFSQPWN